MTFALPSSGTESRDYPIDNGNLVVYVAAVPVAVSSVDTDARAVTLAAPPALGLAVAADYDFYRLCRVDGEFTWTSVGGASFEATIGVVEMGQ